MKPFLRGRKRLIRNQIEKFAIYVWHRKNKIKIPTKPKEDKTACEANQLSNQISNKIWDQQQNTKQLNELNPAKILNGWKFITAEMKDILHLMRNDVV